MRSGYVIFLTIILTLAACQPDPRLSQPQLLSDRAVETQALPTLFVLPTVTPLLGGGLPTPMGVVEIPTLVLESLPTVPLATIDPTQARITPTALASKTPSLTPTQTQTSTVTTTPTITVTWTPPATSEQFAFNGTGASTNDDLIAATNAAQVSAFFAPNPVSVPNPNVAVCTETPWFYDQVGATACPVEQVAVGHASFQRFEIGYMVWLSFNDKIYVMFNTAEYPRWRIYDDVWQEGMPERDDSWYTREVQPPQTWQPRRGFGEIWRRFEDVRYRIGWAVQEWETLYTPRYQMGQDGSIMFQDPYNNIFYLNARGEDWGLYRPR